jgi:hypothetical protein
MFDDELKLSADVGNGTISEKAIEEMRSYLAKQNESIASDEGAFLIPKNDAELEMPTTTDNGAGTQPITDTAQKAQDKEFARIKNKIYGGISK